MTCTVCGGRLERLVHRRAVVIHQNRACASQQAARATPRGELDLRTCATCGFTTNVAFDPSLPIYGEGYDNRQDLSPEFDRYLDTRVEAVSRHVPPEGRVVEIGCGNGAFLVRLCEATGATGWGFDPSYRGSRHPTPAVTLIPDAFDDDTSIPGVDAVVSRHVIEHLPDPLGFLRQIARGTAPGTMLLIETPDVAWIARHGVYWDLFYEHCSLFTEGSLTAALARSGFVVQHVEHVFGEQYLWAEAVRADASAPPPDIAPARLDLAHLRREPAWIERWRRALRAWSHDGAVVAWGAGAKGVTFANLVDPDATLVSALVDINAAKAGGFVPGTGHPILSPGALTRRPIRHVVVLNPRYASEIAEMCEQLGLDVVLHTEEDP